MSILIDFTTKIESDVKFAVNSMDEIKANDKIE